MCVSTRVNLNKETLVTGLLAPDWRLGDGAADERHVRPAAAVGRRETSGASRIFIQNLERLN